MPRWVCILLTAIAAVIGGYAGLIFIGGGAAGIAWIFLFGDDSWPRWGEIAIGLAAVAGALLGALSAGLAVWRTTGKHRH
jgi:hypothetical protein